MLTEGWIATEAAKRLRQHYGTYNATQWESFLEARNLDQWFDELPVGINAFLADDCVYIQRGMTTIDTARRVWHEVGHWALHAGEYTFWLSRPQGYLTVAKFERQANEFAASFPVWED